MHNTTFIIPYMLLVRSVDTQYYNYLPPKCFDIQLLNLAFTDCHMFVSLCLLSNGYFIAAALVYQTDPQKYEHLDNNEERFACLVQYHNYIISRIISNISPGQTVALHKPIKVNFS